MIKKILIILVMKMAIFGFFLPALSQEMIEPEDPAQVFIQNNELVVAWDRAKALAYYEREFNSITIRLFDELKFIELRGDMVPFMELTLESEQAMLSLANVRGNLDPDNHKLHVTVNFNYTPTFEGDMSYVERHYVIDIPMTQPIGDQPIDCVGDDCLKDDSDMRTLERTDTLMEEPQRIKAVDVTTSYVDTTKQEQPAGPKQEQEKEIAIGESVDRQALSGPIEEPLATQYTGGGMNCSLDERSIAAPADFVPMAVIFIILVSASVGNRLKTKLARVRYNSFRRNKVDNIHQGH